MDPDAFTASLLKWDLRGGIAPQQVAQPQPQILHQQQAVAVRYSGLEELLGPYGIRCYTTAKIAELGFTVSTLLDMRDEELDEMMNSVSHVFRLDLLVGERYGIKAAVRAERRRLDDERRALLSDETALDALSQEGSDTMRHVAAQQERELERPKKPSHAPRGRRKREKENPNEDDEGLEFERQREHPFIVTEPGEVARGKKNGLDYLFHLYEQCREFLVQVQRIAKENGDKSPIKVTNQVFRFAKTMGASYINKPKMRHYVHCYALHCLDEETSNALRRAMKERGENVGAWRQACYKPLVNIAARQGWEIDAIFNAHPLLNIWYVPTKLRQLCHVERSNAATTALPPRERFTY